MKSVLSIVTLAIIGINIWLFEILKIKGWYGLQWLQDSLFSPYLIIFISALAFVIPFGIHNGNIKKLILPFFLLSIVNLLCFLGGKYICYALYCKFCFWTIKDIMLLLSLGILLFMLHGLTYWFIANKMIRQNRQRNMLFSVLCSLGMVPLSLLTIQLIKGFGTGTDWVDAVKMGYPVFWTIFFAGIAGIIISGSKLKKSDLNP